MIKDPYVKEDDSLSRQKNLAQRDDSFNPPKMGFDDQEYPLTSVD